MYVQDEILVVKDKIVLEIVDLVKWVADDDDDDAFNQLMTSHAASHASTRGSFYVQAPSLSSPRNLQRKICQNLKQEKNAGRSSADFFSAAFGARQPATPHWLFDKSNTASGVGRNVN